MMKKENTMEMKKEQAIKCLCGLPITNKELESCRCANCGFLLHRVVNWSSYNKKAMKIFSL